MIKRGTKSQEIICMSFSDRFDFCAHNLTYNPTHTHKKDVEYSAQASTRHEEILSFKLHTPSLSTETIATA